MNGVAKDFWSEIHDLHSPIEDGRGSGGGRKQSGRKKARKVLVRRSTPARMAAR